MAEVFGGVEREHPRQQSSHLFGVVTNREDVGGLQVVLVGDGVYADVVVLKPFCERSSQIEGVGVGDVAAHRIAETIRTECVRGVADGLYVNALPLLQDDVPVVGWNTRDDVLGGEVP